MKSINHIHWSFEIILKYGIRLMVCVLTRSLTRLQTSDGVLSGLPPKNEVAGDKLIVGGNRALACLGKAVTFVFAHLELDVTSVFIT